MFTNDRPRYRKRTNRRTLRLETIESRIVPAFAVGVNVDAFVTDLLPPLGSSGAAGLNHYVQFTNGVFTVLNKADGSQALQMDDATFWENAGIDASITGVGLAQPRVIYDALSQTWFAVEINLANTGNLMLLARSNTSDPTGPWQAISYTAVSATRFGNFPTLAVDKNGVYIGTGNFTNGSASASPVSSTMTSFPKTGLINLDTTIPLDVANYLATTTSLTQTSPAVAMGWSPQPVTNFDNADETASVVATHYSTFDLVTYWEISGSSGSGATFGTPVNRAIPHNALPANARQPDGTRDMSGGDDDRYTSAIYQVGDLIYAVHPISVNAAGVGSDYDPFFNPNTTDALQLLVIRDSTNSVVANATYYSPNYDYTFGSVAANQYGDIVIGFNRSGGLGSAQGNLGAYAVHAKIDPANPTTITFLEQVELKAGLATNYNLTGTVIEPWGPYSATSPDPSNPFAFWTTQQYVAAADTWGTRVAQLFVSPSAQSLTSSAANGQYGLGEEIPITVTFNGNVKVTGTPRLLLNSGGTAFYSSGTGSNQLTFLYTVGGGDLAADLDYLSTAALELNGGTINLDVSTAAVPAELTLPTPGAAGSLGFNKDISVNAQVPAVASVLSTALDATYGFGEVIPITVNFTRDAVVTGAPQLALNSGGVAFYNSGDGTSSLTFLYTVGIGHGSLDLDYLSTTSLTLSGGTIIDEITLGNALLTLPTPGASGSLGFNKNIVIDALPPKVTGVSSPVLDGTYNFGAVIPIEITFDKIVQVDGTPTLTLNSGGTAFYSSINGTVLTFNYQVGAGQSTLDLNYTSALDLVLNGGSITEVASGQNAVLTLPAPNSAGSLGTNKNIVIDTLPPKVTSVSSPMTNGTYHFSDVITIEITFDKAVQVSGPAPSLTLNNGGEAIYFSANGTVLTFHYTVGAGQSTPDLNYASTSSLALNGGTITEVGSGQNANLTLPSPGGAGSLGTNKDIAIDTSQAHVTDVTSTNANGIYIVGAIIDINVTFDQSVVVGGTPRLNLNSGGFAEYVSGSGSATLLFRYTVSAGESSGDLDYANASALNLNGGSIQAAGQDAVLILPTPGNTGSLGFNKNIVVDAIIPELLQFRVLFGSKSYNILDSSRIRLPWRITGVQAVFSEPIVTGNRFSLGGLSATSFVGKNTNKLTWKFIAKVKGSFNATLADSGVNALKDASGNPIAAFSKAFQVLYGDVDDSGVVNAADETVIRQSIRRPYQPSSANYNIFADLSGDGIVNLIDVTIARSRRGQTLP